MATTFNLNIQPKVPFNAENMQQANNSIDYHKPVKSKPPVNNGNEVKTIESSDAFDKRIDAIEEEAGMTPKPKSKEVKEQVSKTEPKKIQYQQEESLARQTTSKSSTIYSTIASTSAIIRGSISGIISGFFAGTLVAGLDMIVSGAKRVKNKDIKFYQILNPKKTLSKSGKNFSIAAAAIVLIGHIISAVIRSKKQTEK